MPLSKSSIDWPGLNYTWPIIIGCKNGCSKETIGYDCWAEKLHTQRHNALLKGKQLPEQYRIPFNVPTFYPDRLNDPTKVKKPSTIFVGSMCDIFSNGVKIEWIYNIISVAVATPRHTFMFLTKKPESYTRFNWPTNCWLGTTIEKGDLWGRMEIMRGYLPNKLFVSIEPILGEFYDVYFDGIDLVIIGADSSRGAVPPKLEWVQSIKHHNIYYKQNILKYFPQLQNKQP